MCIYTYVSLFTAATGMYMGFPGGSSTCQRRRWRRHGFSPWVGKIPWRRKWQPTPVFLSGKSHGQRSLVGYSPWGCQESDTTEWISTQAVCVYMCFSSTIYLIYTPNSNSTFIPFYGQINSLFIQGPLRHLTGFFSLLLIWEVSLICLWVLRPWHFISFLKMNWLVWRITVWLIFLLIKCITQVMHLIKSHTLSWALWLSW